ncbi:RloB family protein [Streptomyces sp. NPDC090080]|uniref:RloB family protein n=1 Tax=Streptomyces sp. NPDC090080 TaxID=3365939 RepID=UPI0037F3FD06
MNRRQVRGSQRISKSHGKRSENKKILIVTEGVKTEPQYFEGLAAHLNAQAVHVISLKPVGTGRDPMSVVREADSQREKERRNGDAFDSVWCVVDVDEHATLPAACTLAAREKMGLAISSPCFEIWLLWHYEDRLAWSTGGALAQRLKKFGVLGKNLPANFPYDRFVDAKQRAEKCAVIELKHKPPNPSSSVSELVSELELASKGKSPQSR